VLFHFRERVMPRLPLLLLLWILVEFGSPNQAQGGICSCVQLIIGFFIPLIKIPSKRGLLINARQFSSSEFSAVGT
jgi:hypothetical protein